VLNSSEDSGTLNLDLIDIIYPSSPVVRLGLPIKFEPIDATMVSEPPPVNAPRLAGLTPNPYVHDEKAERIIVLLLLFDTDFVTIAISVRHLIQRFFGESSCVWREWGPDATRWIRGLGAYGSHSCVSGSMFCTQTHTDLRANEEGYYDGQPPPSPDDDEEEETSRTIAIFDFNPRPIRKLGDSDGDGIPEEEDRMIGKPIVDEWVWEDELFSEPVKSRLPFRLFARRWPTLYDEVMISSDHLVGRRMDVCQSIYILLLLLTLSYLIASILRCSSI
jgi:hypothetical protein